VSFLFQDSSLIPLLGESPGHGRLETGSRDGGGGGGSGTGQPSVGEEHFPEEIVAAKKSGMGRAVSLLTTCYSSSDDHEMSLSASTKIEDLVPPYYVHAGNMHRLIKVSQLSPFLHPPPALVLNKPSGYSVRLRREKIEIWSS